MLPSNSEACSLAGAKLCTAALRFLEAESTLNCEIAIQLLNLWLTPPKAVSEGSIYIPRPKAPRANVAMDTAPDASCHFSFRLSHLNLGALNAMFLANRPNAATGGQLVPHRPHQPRGQGFGS